jgi:alpha-aminoadipate/glutamate carrier protein LysW
MGHPKGRDQSSKKVPEAPIMAVVCPECDNPIVVDTDEAEEGETVLCEECGMELEIVSIDPLELAPVDVSGYDDEEDAHAVDEDDE